MEKLPPMESLTSLESPVPVDPVRPWSHASRWRPGGRQLCVVGDGTAIVSPAEFGFAGAGTGRPHTSEMSDVH